MRFYSTRNPQLRVGLKQAVLSALAPEGGLYMPEVIPKLTVDTLENMRSMDLVGVSQEMAAAFLAQDIPRDQLDIMVAEAMSFPIPLHPLDETTAILETFHGPTMAFKDVGARFMARLMSHLIQGEERRLTILVATSGDTGSAVAAGFLGVPNIDVVILYPSGKVSPNQEQQLTTQGQNIHALEVAGSFDDCQALVKQAFQDDQLNQSLWLTSANSINIARLLPQSFYHAYAASRSEYADQKLVISVPSGNFGNLTAGLIAREMGLPIHHFVAAVNANDGFAQFMASGEWQAKASIQTISNAMDVGDPSNLVRILDLYDQNVDTLRDKLYSWSFSDTDTRKTIGDVYAEYGTIMDPHTAVGFLGLQRYRREVDSSVNGVVVSTAHPAKFPEQVGPLLGKALEMPPQLARYLDREKQARAISATYSDLVDALHILT